MLYPIINVKAFADDLSTGVYDEGADERARTDLAQAAFNFLPTRVLLDLEGWPEQDIFAH